MGAGVLGGVLHVAYLPAVVFGGLVPHTPAVIDTLDGVLFSGALSVTDVIQPLTPAVGHATVGVDLFRATATAGLLGVVPHAFVVVSFTSSEVGVLPEGAALLTGLIGGWLPAAIDDGGTVWALVNINTGQCT